MKRSLRGALAEMVESYRGGTSLALLFDYDGTLVFAPRPDLAVMSRVTQQRLERLAHHLRYSSVCSAAAPWKT